MHDNATRGFGAKLVETMTTSEFEARYREIRAQGARGWAGANHERSVLKDRQTLDQLNSEGLLPGAGANAIELGCGNGALAAWFSDNGFRYLGIDISETGIAWAAAEQPPSTSIAFRRGDVRDLSPLHDCLVQMIFDSACLHCLIGKDRGFALSEARRVLDPGGVFILSSMCGQPEEMPESVTYDKMHSLLIRNTMPYRTLKSCGMSCNNDPLRGGNFV